MIGIIYLNEDKQIISIIRDVLSVTSTDVVGKESAVKGVDVSLASIAIVEETELEVGDTLGSFTDVRDLIPKSPEQMMIAMLQVQSGELLFELALAQDNIAAKDMQMGVMLMQLAAIQEGMG